MGSKSFENFKVCIASLKIQFVFVYENWYSQTLNQYSMVQKFRFKVLTDSKPTLQETPI